MIRSLVMNCNGDAETASLLRRNVPAEALEVALADGSVLWIDLVDPEPEELDWLARALQINPLVVQDLRRDDRRPALLVYPTYLFLSLFQPRIQRGEVGGREVHCLVGDTYFVTVRHESAGAVDLAYNRVAQNPESCKRGPAYFLFLTAQHVIDAYYPLLDEISGLMSRLDEELLQGAGRSPKEMRPTVYRLKQQLINLRQMVAPQREVLSNVIGELRISGADETRDLFRHLYERLLRVYDVIDSQRDLSSNLLDIMQNQESRRLLEVVNRLTLYSMIFLPLTFLISLFDINFLDAAEPLILPLSGWAVLTLILLVVAAAGLFSIAIFRRRGWL
jgi:magnesium transporter